MQSKFRVSKTTLFLCVFLLVAQFISGLNTARTGGSDAFRYWYVITYYWALGWWFINDSRNNGIKWVDDYLDMGILLYITWVFLVPLYLFKTRGWKKSILMIFIFLGIFFGAYLSGWILYSIVSIFL